MCKGKKNTVSEFNGYFDSGMVGYEITHSNLLLANAQQNLIHQYLIPFSNENV